MQGWTLTSTPTTPPYSDQMQSEFDRNIGSGTVRAMYMKKQSVEIGRNIAGAGQIKSNG